MLHVKTLNEVERIIEDHFSQIDFGIEEVHISESSSRILAEDIVSGEYIPDYNRSSVDGYAVISSDLFGCTETIPAVLESVGKVAMGSKPSFTLKKGQCAYVPTGGYIPSGADAMIMIEFTEDYYDGTVGMNKPVAPGQHLIFRGDDVKKADVVLKNGNSIGAKEIGILAALGRTKAKVRKRLIVGVISTGDELVPSERIPENGQIRDINAPILLSELINLGCEPIFFGIIPDQYELLRETIKKAILQCDMLILSGGTSVGEKDATPIVIKELGNLLIHGIAIKPGKPTLIGEITGKPIFGLPGHPVAAYFMFHLLIVNLIQKIKGIPYEIETVRANLTNAISSNHGREECIPVQLTKSNSTEDQVKQMHATPIHGKSGLISTLLGADGYIRIDRDCEGISEGTMVTVFLFQ